MFDIPGSDIVGVRIDEETIKTNKCPEYIYARSATSVDNDLENSIDSKISIPTG